MNLLNKILRELNPMNDNIYDLDEPREYFKSMIRGGIAGVVVGYAGNKLGLWDTSLDVAAVFGLDVDLCQYILRGKIHEVWKNYFSQERESIKGD